MNTICVTALYDIGREAYDGRKWSDYIQWFSKILKLKTPLVVFGENNLKEFVEEHRKDIGPTWFFEKPFKNLSYYPYKDSISKIINSKEYKIKVNQPHRLECNLPEYTVIIYSKLDLMTFVCEKMSCNNVFWVDAGCSRFIDDRVYKNIFPNESAVQTLQGRFYIQKNSYFQYLLNTDPNIMDENLFWKAIPLTAAGFMGGQCDVVKKIAEKQKEVFESLMIHKNVIATEENALGYILQKEPELFFPVLSVPGQPLWSINLMGVYDE